MGDLDELGRVCALAERQWGQVSLAQLDSVATREALDRWERAGLVEPVTDRVLRVRAGARHPFPQLYAAWLVLDPRPAWERSLVEAVASHRSAVRAYRAAALPTTTPEFTVPPGTPHPPNVVVYPVELHQRDVVVIDGLPVTSPARTLADLSAGAGLDQADLGRIAQALLTQGWASAEGLAAELTEAFSARGTALDGAQWLHTTLDAAAV